MTYRSHIAKACCVCKPAGAIPATYRVDYQSEASEYFCDDHILISGVEPIRGIHKLSDDDLEQPCVKPAM